MSKLKIFSLFILLFYFLTLSGCEKSKKAVEPDGNNLEPGVPILSISRQTAGFDEVYELSFSVEEAESYVVQESMNTQFSNPMSFPADSTKKSFSHKVDSPTLFYYRVQGISGADSSGWSQTVSITVNPLERPSGFVSEEYSLSGQEFTLSWTKVNKAQSYTIEEAAEKYFINPAVLNTQDSLLTISRNVQSIQNFYYRVKAVHEDFVSPWSDTLMTMVLPFVLSAPEFSENSLKTGSGNTYIIYWTDTGLSYTLEEATDNAFLNVNRFHINDTLKGFYHTRDEGTKYYYRVRTHGIPGQNDSSWSSTCEVTFFGMIAFQSDRDGNDEIYVMNEDGTNQRNVSNNPATDIQPSWSPDGSQIAFVSVRDGNYEIYIMNADGTDQRKVTNNPGYDMTPSWSPDGSEIAYVSDRDGNGEIYVMNSVGTNLRDITNNPAWDISPSWSPDGSQIAFVSVRDGNYEIYIMNADGTDQRRLTNSPYMASFPSWSPDGLQIMFLCSYTSGAYIYIMNADGTNLSNLTNNPNLSPIDAYPSWSPDGSQILYSSYRDGYREIFLMDADGTNLRNLTNVPSDNTYPSWSPK